jgi:hypothetical protein
MPKIAWGNFAKITVLMGDPVGRIETGGMGLVPG